MKTHRLVSALAASALCLTAVSTAAQHAPGHVEPSSERESETPRTGAARVETPSGGEHVEWGYTGPGGPEHWAELSEQYGVCSRGQQESPINLKDAIPAQVNRLSVDWRPVPLRVTNNGHTIQVNAPAGSTLSMGGRSYALAQMHLHHPSEHLLNGRRYPLELHFVHRGPDGVLGVVGVFVEQGRANPALQTVLDAMPAGRGQTRAVAGRTLDFNRFMPRDSAFYRYEGSLTTPPCTENVQWAVMAKTIQASAEQINAFEAVYPFNARPVQALNRRFLLRSL